MNAALRVYYVCHVMCISGSSCIKMLSMLCFLLYLLNARVFFSLLCVCHFFIYLLIYYLFAWFLCLLKYLTFILFISLDSHCVYGTFVVRRYKLSNSISVLDFAVLRCKHKLYKQEIFFDFFLLVIYQKKIFNLINCFKCLCIRFVDEFFSFHLEWFRSMEQGFVSDIQKWVWTQTAI